MSRFGFNPIPPSHCFSHEEACRIAELAVRAASTRTIVVDLSQAEWAATAAFARLVLLRQQLLRSGRDLRLAGLHDHAAALYDISRLGGVLPRSEPQT